MEKCAKMLSLNFRCFNWLPITRGSLVLLPGLEALKQAGNRPITSLSRASSAH